MTGRFQDAAPTLVLLVHPDCALELGAEFGSSYLARLQRLLPAGADVVTHWMLSDEFVEIARDWPAWRDRLPVLAEMRCFLSARGVAVHDEPVYRAAFDGPVLDWVVAHPGGRIVLGGGYRGNCVRLTREALEDDLGDLLREQGVSVMADEDLCFEERR